MAGNTGKMTNEAIVARGPRMQLIGLSLGNRTKAFYIRHAGTHCARPTTGETILVYAESYSLGYLRSVARGMMIGASNA